MPPAPRRPAGTRLARVAGINIEFHPSWIIILLLIGWSLGAYFRAADPHWSNLAVWLAAGVTTVLFFVSVVLHELAHSLVARARGLPVHVITLFVFGGVSELTREPDTPGDEFKIAIAGPATSLAIGAICLAVASLGTPQQPVFAVAEWLGWINIILALFNLIPGFPLDGGRVLRAILWGANHNLLQSTRRAAQVGKAVAIAFILIGVWEFFTGRGLEGLWLAFIGWFLLNAAEQSWRQIELQSALGHYTVRDLETPFFSRVPPDWNLEAFIAELASQHNFRASLVMDQDEQLLGIITPADLARFPREHWGTTLVRDAMVPRAQLATVLPNEGLASALKKMAEHNVGQLPVLADGAVRGIIRRDRIIQLLHGHFESGARS